MPLTLNILDQSGTVIRSFSSVSPPKSAASADDSGGGDEDEGGFRATWPTVLDAKPGMHRFTWDLRYFGAWMSESRPHATNGPVAVPGNYSVQIKLGDWSATQPLSITEDPRVTRPGVSQADLVAQFNHNMLAMALLNDINHLVARVKTEQATLHAANADATPKAQQLQALADKLITPRIRYSQPALQSHVSYLYSMTNRTDQKIGEDAVERYKYLRQQVDAAIVEMDRITRMTE